MPRDDRYFGDTCYEVWRRGGNPDNVDRDQCQDYEDDGLSSDAAAGRFMPRRREPEPEQEQEYPEEQFPDPADEQTGEEGCDLPLGT
ncbi:MAG: hypothetical protein WC829_02805 [Hyphomicrobium sp.]